MVNIRDSGLLLMVMVEHLGGLLFDGWHSCTEDSFVGHSGLYRGDFLSVSKYTCLCVRLGWRPLNRSVHFS